MASPRISTLVRRPGLAVALPLLIVAIALAAVGRLQTALATTGGPTLQMSGPSVVDANASFDISFATAGSTTNAYAGYQVAFQYDTSKVQLNVNGPADDSRPGLWLNRSCTSSWDSPADPNQATKTATLSCLAPPAQATLSVGALAHAHFTAVGAGLATFHVLTSGTSTLDANGAPQTNPTPGDVTVDVAPTDLSMSVTPSTVAATGDTQYFYLQVTNLSPTRQGTGVVVSDTVPAAFPLAQHPFFLSGASGCAAQGQVITCNVGTIAGGGTYTVGVITTAQWSGIPSAQDCASVTLNEHDLHPENNTSCATVLNKDGPSINVSTSRLGLNSYRLTFATAGTSPNAYNIYKVTVVYDSSRVTINNISAPPFAQALWGNALCDTPEMTSTVGGTLAPPMKAFAFDCASNGAPATTNVGTIGTVDVQIADGLPAAFHMLSYGPPDNGAGVGSYPVGYGTYTMFAGGPQANPLTCGGSCGVLQGYATQPWDALVNYPSPNLSLIVYGNHSPIVVGAVENFSLTVRNPSTTVDATGVNLTATLSSAYDGPHSRIAGANAPQCSLSGQLVSCNNFTIAPGAAFSIVVQALAAQLTPAADMPVSLTWNYYQPPNTTNTLSALGRVSVEVDSSGDGYADSEKIAMGKNPATYCAIRRADVNYDGVVDINDLNAVSAYYQQNIPPAPPRYDQNGDGRINLTDIAIMSSSNVLSHSVTECP
jgi:hypothetical protein